MLSALITAMTCAAMSASPGAGDAAPPITIEHALQTPEGVTLDWAAFGDAPVLLEFWGTWCGPCVAAIPHLNDLAAELRDDGLRVLAVTFEEPEVVEKFLKLRSIDGWVLCDTDRSMVEDFGVVSWPQTFLIQEGKILLRTNPAALNAEVIRDVFAGRLDGKEMESASRSSTVTAGVDPMDKKATGETFFQLTIREAGPDGGMSASSGFNATMLGVDATGIVAWAWGISSRYVDLGESFSERRFDLIFNAPPGGVAEVRMAIQSIVRAALGVEVLMEERAITGFELRTGEDGVTLPAAATDYGGFGMNTRPDGSFSVTGSAMSLEALSSTLSGVFGAPVRCGIKDEKKYFVELHFKGRESGQIIEALREQAGIEVVPYETTVTFAVVAVSDSSEQD